MTGFRGSFLRFSDEAGQPQELMLTPELQRVTIGRSSQADLTLSWDAEVSRLHAAVEYLGAQWTIIDDGLSRNGTFVNGRRVAGRRRLTDGDALRVGATVVLFRSPRGAPAPTRSASVGVTADRLSDTQRKVLAALCRPCGGSQHLASPASNQQISEALYLSLDAVKANLRAMYQLFGVAQLPQNQKRAQLAERAILWGLLGAGR
jgi:pSer/pThr/pTyr-binding forkhead associated (FHA) protein